MVILRGRDKTDQKNRQLDHNTITEVSIWLYVIPLLIFTAIAGELQGWASIYYCWDKGKDCVWICILYGTLSEGKRNRLFPIVFFSFLRFLWELIATIFNMGVNFPYYVDWVFYTLCVFTITLTIKDLRKNVKKNANGSP